MPLGTGYIYPTSRRVDYPHLNEQRPQLFRLNLIRKPTERKHYQIPQIACLTDLMTMKASAATTPALMPL
jgi:hypothetical protein